MNAALLLALFGRKPEQVTVTFNANTTWPVPAGVNVLASVTGHGTNGSASYDNTSTVWIRESDSFWRYHYPDGHYEEGPHSVSSTTYTSDPGPKPADFQSSTITHTPDATNGYDSAVFYTFYFQHTETRGSSSAGSYGVSATGFGFTFPGGTPSTPTAVTSTYTNVALNQPSYPVVVPSGATIQITYYL